MGEQYKMNSNSFDTDLEQLDLLLERGVNDISDIEIEEITRGLSIDEIEEQFSSDGSIKIERSEFSRIKKTGDLTIEDSVQFITEDKRTEIEHIPLDEIELLKSVKQEDLLARTSITDENRQRIKELLTTYDDSFQEAAGVFIKRSGDGIGIHAARNGKVVIFHGRIHVVCADADGKCSVHVAPDKMCATIDLHIHRGNGVELSLSLVLDELEKNNVIKGLDRSLLEESIKRAVKEKCDIFGITAAVGKKPIDGENAKVNFECTTEVPDIGFRILPDGRIDYRKQAPIKMVQDGVLLATVSEPGKGTPGYTVDGEELAAKDGDEDVLINGQNVRVDKTGKNFFASCSGMVSIHDHILEVFPLYQVDGDVDMHCGNINFNGSVTVLGTVQTGFEVKAAGDIFITGSVENAKIEAGRDVRINGAIVGSTDSHVIAGRNVFAGHAQNARIEAQGDVVIVRSLMHSTVYSTGKLYLHDMNGSIIGGLMNTFRGIECMSIGSAMGTATEVVIGSDYLLQRKKSEIDKIIKFMVGNISKIDMVLKPLMNIVKKGIPLGIDKKRRLKSIVDKRKQLTKQLDILRHKARMLENTHSDSDSASAIVQNTLYSDVTIKMFNAALKTNQPLKGVRCKFNKKDNKIDTVGLNMISF